MLVDLDFRALRDEVEGATRLPDLAELKRRVKRIRARDRLAVLGALLATLAVFAPVALASIFGRPNYSPSPVQPEIIEEPTPTPSDAADLIVKTQVRAAAGQITDTVFAAVDVCLDNAANTARRRCNLQVVSLRAGQPDGRLPYAVNAIRTDPTQRVDDVRLVALSPRAVLLSGTVGANPRTNIRITAAGADTPKPPTFRVPLVPGDRIFQLEEGGEIYGARQSDGALSALPSQPALTHRTVATVSPLSGWWVTGVDDLGRPAVAVSRDQGRTWVDRSLGAPGGQLDVPTIATWDGKTVHAYVRYSTGLRQYRSTDGGRSWAGLSTPITLTGPLAMEGALAGREFGALARSDGSVLLWVQDVQAPIFFNSSDGEHFGSYQGPGGSVVVIDGGYVTLGARAELSNDCASWTPAALPTPIEPNR